MLEVIQRKVLKGMHLPFEIKEIQAGYLLRQSFLGGAGSHYALQVNPSAVPHFRFKLSENIYTQTLHVAYLILYLIYSGSTSFT